MEDIQADINTNVLMSFNLVTYVILIYYFNILLLGLFLL